MISNFILVRMTCNWIWSWEAERGRTQKNEHAPLQEMGWEKEGSLTSKPHNDISSKDAQVSLKGHLWNKRLRILFQMLQFLQNYVYFLSHMYHRVSLPAHNYPRPPTKAIFCVRNERTPWYATEVMLMTHENTLIHNEYTFTYACMNVYEYI